MGGDELRAGAMLAMLEELRHDHERDVSELRGAVEHTVRGFKEAVVAVEMLADHIKLIEEKIEKIHAWFHRNDPAWSAKP